MPEPAFISFEGGMEAESYFLTWLLYGRPEFCLPTTGAFFSQIILHPGGSLGFGTGFFAQTILHPGGSFGASGFFTSGFFTAGFGFGGRLPGPPTFIGAGTLIALATTIFFCIGAAEPLPIIFAGTGLIIFLG